MPQNGATRLPMSARQALARFPRWFDDHREFLVEALLALVKCDTVSPGEHRALPLVEELLSTAGATCVIVPEHPAVAGHPLSSRCSPDAPDKRGLRGTVRAPGPETLAVSAHIDVVPMDNFMGPHATAGRDRVFGRGTADTKGNLIALVAALQFLAETGVTPSKSVVADVVFEEELGGNGALSSVLHGLDATACVVLEPTSLEVFCGHRGCLGFSVMTATEPTHMGAGGERLSAIDAAVVVIGRLRELEARLIEDARADKFLCSWDRPVQLNLAAIHGGEWHGSVAAKCTLSGNIGVPPSTPLEVAKELVRDCLRELDIVAHVEFNGLHTESYVMGPSPLTDALERAGAQTPCGLRAWNVSCDARTYFNIGGLPTAVFGAGSLEAAHSKTESIATDDIGAAALVLARLLVDEMPLGPVAA